MALQPLSSEKATRVFFVQQCGESLDIEDQSFQVSKYQSVYLRMMKL